MKFIITLVILFNSILCFGQQDALVLLDSVLQRARLISLYTTSVYWDSLRWEAERHAEHAESVGDLSESFTILLNGLKDMHGRILSAKDYSTIAAFTNYLAVIHPDQRPRDPVVREKVYDASHGFEANMIDDHTGYIRIPGYPPDVDIQAVARQIRDALSQLIHKGAKQWIIDLRYNSGGNMHPMVAGIAPLIGNGIVGYLMDLKGQRQLEWEIKDGNFIYAGYQAVDIPDEMQFKTLPPVAVLMSRWTVSSGEVVATCFKGRPNTRFFGEMSGSLTTNTSWDIIGNEVILNISTGVFADRDGTIYPYNIPVDVEVPFELPERVENDQCIQNAMDWLKRNR